MFLYVCVLLSVCAGPVTSLQGDSQTVPMSKDHMGLFRHPGVWVADVRPLTLKEVSWGIQTFEKLWGEAVKVQVLFLGFILKGCCEYLDGVFVLPTFFV